MAHDSSNSVVNFDRFLPSDQHLFPFQHVGVAYALMQSADGKGVFIADEQGLGKTRQAIVLAKAHAALLSNRKPKVLVVCKSALKLNWAKEYAMCAPELDVHVAGGTRPYELEADVVIISFNLLRVWADALILEQFTGLIIDESHCVKDGKTQQTKAATKIATDVRSRRGLVALLSGTPFLNKPAELVSQLAMIGRLEDVCPRPRRPQPTARDWEYSFLNNFCNPVKVNIGRGETRTKYEGATQGKMPVLNSRMRQHFMVRRLRKEVLNMSETHRIHVPLSLNGDLNHYWDVEANFTPKDSRSAAIELLTALRQAAALCKINAGVEWVQDFIAENPGKKLVAWAWHIPVQAGLAEALNAAGIKAVYLKGEQDKGRIEEAKAEFNEGNAQVIVCSLQAHREGHTLLGDGTNVTDSVFIEQPWHPGAVAQAEDRISRIGRQADAVFAHTLIAPGTVDEWLEGLISEKWSTFTAGVDGKAVEGQQASMIAAMLAKLQAHMIEKYGPDRVAGWNFPTPPQEGDLA